MTDIEDEFRALADAFLPPDPKKIEEADASHDDVDVMSMILGAFSAMVRSHVSCMERQRRREFCRRVAAMSEGEVQGWMVEAVLRGLEGDPDALAGTDPEVTSSIHAYGVYLLGNEYLSAQECRDLRSIAIRNALEFRPHLTARPRA